MLWRVYEVFDVGTRQGRLLPRIPGHAIQVDHYHGPGKQSQIYISASAHFQTKIQIKIASAEECAAKCLWIAQTMTDAELADGVLLCSASKAREDALRSAMDGETAAKAAAGDELSILQQERDKLLAELEKVSTLQLWIYAC